MRREDENSMKRIMTAEVNGCRMPCSRGLQKKQRGEIIQQDMKSLRLKKEHTCKAATRALVRRPCSGMAALLRHINCRNYYYYYYYYYYTADRKKWRGRI